MARRKSHCSGNGCTAQGMQLRRTSRVAVEDACPLAAHYELCAMRLVRADEREGKCWVDDHSLHVGKTSLSISDSGATAELSMQSCCNGTYVRSELNSRFQSLRTCTSVHSSQAAPGSPANSASSCRTAPALLILAPCKSERRCCSVALL